MLAYCPSSSEWGLGDDIGEIKAARKELVTLSHKADGSVKVYSVTGTSLTQEPYMEQNLYTVLKVYAE